jgi:hypothetical protein
METREIIRAIKKLPVSKRMLIVERTLQTIKESETKDEMLVAAEVLVDDYVTDKELTSFTRLDYEEFSNKLDFSLYTQCPASFRLKNLRSKFVERNLFQKPIIINTAT